jgi:hypothetical protein
MFELHVVVAGIIMLNIMELIIEIVPNSPTEIRVGCKNRSGEGWYARLFDKGVYDVYTQ